MPEGCKVGGCGNESGCHAHATASMPTASVGRAPILNPPADFAVLLGWHQLAKHLFHYRTSQTGE